MNPFTKTAPSGKQHATVKNTDALHGAHPPDLQHAQSKISGYQQWEEGHGRDAEEVGKADRDDQSP